MASRVKSRADKTRDKDKGASNAGKETLSSTNLANDIVAGKFSETDWTSLLKYEDEEDFAAGIIEEVIENVLEGCYGVYIQQQLLPYTVEQARNALIEIIEWRFMEKDSGESDDAYVNAWVEDDEPEPAYLDSWAAGAVPYSVSLTEEQTDYSKSVEPILEETTADNEDADDENRAEEPSEVDDASLPRQQEEPIPESVDNRPLPEEPISEPSPPKEAPKKKKRKYVPHRGPIRSAGVSKMGQTLYETELMLEQMARLNTEQTANSEEMPIGLQNALKAQAGRPGVATELPINDIHVVVAPERPAVEVLPALQTKTNFAVVDPEVEEAHARLIAMRTGRYNTASASGGKKPTDKREKPQQEFKSSQQVTYEAAASNQVAPVPPPLIESMEVSAGVTVREGGRVKQGLKRLQKQSISERNLQETVLLPVSKNRAKPLLAVSDIIDPIGLKTRPAALPPIA